MDFSSIIDNIKDKISSITEQLSDWINENKKLSIIIGGAALLILICLMMIIIFSSGKSKAKNEEKEIPEQFTLTEPLQIPLNPELDKDYNISRKTKSEWSTEEVEEWFTEPSLKEVDNLSKANDKIIDEITGAAP